MPRAGASPVSAARTPGCGKLKYEAGLEQRTRLVMEGVRFIGKRVDMATHQHRFRTWEFD